MSEVKLVWVTPEAEKMIMRTARVSNPKNQFSDNTKLLKYCYEHKHFSIFEMANMCIEINTSRAISRQIIRHKSLHVQEFSQRYTNIKDLSDKLVTFEARSQDPKNRQNSTDDMSEEDKEWFVQAQEAVWAKALNYYDKSLEKGIAKEQARALLPEGLTNSRLYLNGTIRSWIHYCAVRCDSSTQQEHIEVAQQCKEILLEQIPTLKGIL